MGHLEKEQILVTGNKISTVNAIHIDNWFPADSKDSILGLCINSSSLQLGIYHTAENCFQYYNSVQLDDPKNSLSEFLGSMNIVRHEFAETFVTLSGIPFTLIPDVFFSEELLKEYFEFTHSDTWDLEFIYDIEIKGLKKIGGIDNEIKSILAPFLKVPVYIMKNSILINHFIKETSDEKRCLAIIDDDQLEIIVSGKGSLIYDNQFRFAGTRDLLYYILMVLDQNDLDPQKNYFCLNGMIDKDSRYYVALSNYIRNISFYPGNLPFEVSRDFVSIPQQYYSSFFYAVYENYRRKIQG